VTNECSTPESEYPKVGFTYFPKQRWYVLASQSRRKFGSGLYFVAVVEAPRSMESAIIRTAGAIPFPGHREWMLPNAEVFRAFNGLSPAVPELFCEHGVYAPEEYIAQGDGRCGWHGKLNRRPFETIWSRSVQTRERRKLEKQASS
jgi:hypothetical protein